MNAETDAPQPAPMTEFEMRSLALLESIDARLNVVETAAEYFYRQHKSTQAAMAAMNRIGR